VWANVRPTAKLEGKSHSNIFAVIALRAHSHNRIVVVRAKHKSVSKLPIVFNAHLLDVTGSLDRVVNMPTIKPVTAEIRRQG